VQRRFAAAVGADEAHPLAGVDDERNVFQNHAVGVGFGEIADLKHGLLGPLVQKYVAEGDYPSTFHTCTTVSPHGPALCSVTYISPLS